MQKIIIFGAEGTGKSLAYELLDEEVISLDERGIALFRR